MTLWINGDWVTGLGERRVKTNPVSGDVLWQGNDADAAQVAQACRAARAAFASWAKQPFGARQAIVEKFASLLEPGMRVPESITANYRMAQRRCAIARTACWRFLARITSPAIYPMVILFRHCWQATH